LKDKVANLVRNPILIETIKVQNGNFMYIQYHNARYNATRRQLFGITRERRLENEISIPGYLTDEVYKCRITYHSKIEKVEFEPYKARSVASLKVVADNEIDYPFKYADRSAINDLFSQKGDCDDILIVKNGFLTDASYANIALWSDNKWFTPATPLLFGTTRSRLIRDEKLIEQNIRAGELYKFQKLRLFNAMMDIELPINKNTIQCEP
jgi:4-amino-4-deoxychorismate lyase